MELVLIRAPEEERGKKLHDRAYSALFQLLWKQYGLEKEPLLERDSYGKPYLKEQAIIFNLSHSRNGFLAIAAGTEREARSVGIDVEWRFPFGKSLARKILHPEEAECLQRKWELGEDLAGSYLNRIWSRKEAYLKCIGSGIRSDLSQIRLDFEGRKGDGKASEGMSCPDQADEKVKETDAGSEGKTGDAEKAETSSLTFLPVRSSLDLEETELLAFAFIEVPIENRIFSFWERQTADYTLVICREMP